MILLKFLGRFIVRDCHCSSARICPQEDLEAFRVSSYNSDYNLIHLSVMVYVSCSFLSDPEMLAIGFDLSTPSTNLVSYLFSSYRYRCSVLV